MTITTNDSIWKFGVQDEVTTGTPGTIANNAFSVAGDVNSAWSNDDDAERASAILKCQFDTTMPTTGSVGLFARCLDIDGSTNDMPVPDANFGGIYIDDFPIDFGVAADTDFYTGIDDFKIPMFVTAQIIEWYLKNMNTGQIIGISWQLWIGPKANGPHA